MKITEVRKKVKQLKSLMSDYAGIDALIKYMEKPKSREENADGVYLNNLRKRRDKITESFDEILK